MKKTVVTVLSFLILALIISTGSCKKGDADAQSAEDAARGSYILADAFAIANDGQGGKLNKRFSEECFDIEEFEGGFQINFYECTDEDGIYRDGSIRVVAAAEAWTGGSEASITITFINYIQDDEGISGTITAHAGIGLFGLYFTLNASNLTLMYENGDKAIIKSSNLSWTATLSGIDYNGSTSGTNRNGVSYSTVAEDLVFGFCPWPTKGIITVNIEGEKEITINFDQDGNAQCDNIFLVSQKRYDDVEVTF